MPGRTGALKPGRFGVLEGFSGSMTPQFIPSNVSGLNFIKIDCSHHLSPKTDRVCEARPRQSVHTWKIWRFSRIFGFHDLTIYSIQHFWAEKLILAIIHQFLFRKTKINKYALNVSTI
jgi:hypothetical protein